MFHQKILYVFMMSTLLFSFIYGMQELGDLPDDCQIVVVSPSNNKEFGRGQQAVEDIGMQHGVLEKFLTKRLDGTNKEKEQIVSIYKTRSRRKNKRERRRQLEKDAQQIRTQYLETQSPPPQLAAQMALMQLLAEREKQKELRENSDWWKKINFGATVTSLCALLGTVGGLIKTIQNCGDPGSNMPTNCTTI